MMPVTLPARLFAPAWHNVSLASGQDPDGSPALFRTMLVEIHGPGEARLVATDSYLFLQTWVAADETPDPGFGVLPEDDHLILVADPEGLAKQFTTHLLKATKADGPGSEREVTMRLGSLEDPARPTLMPELDRQGLTLITDDLRVQLPVIETPFPSWRQMWPSDERRAPAGRCTYSLERLARLAKIKDLVLGTVSLTFTTAIGPTIVEVDAEPRITGLMMPIRDEDSEPAGPKVEETDERELVGAGT
jgi:hypothetical protein